jgi:SAM-dependent methyltransferase
VATEQVINCWPQNACARAFWGQQELPAYRRLLADTAAWLDPQAGQRWLDLGCGGGPLSAMLWRASGGSLAEVVGLDCAAMNAKAYADLRAALQPPPGERLRFVQGDFSSGLSQWQDGYFDGIVSGLAIQYAESYSQEERCWTTAAYDHVLREIRRLLRPGGVFVFSVNVPDPSWGRVALASVTGVFQTRRPLRYLKRTWRMWRYSSWVRSEAKRGRFHYLSIPALVAKLTDAGLGAIEHRLSYANQAYLIRCQRPCSRITR